MVVLAIMGTLHDKRKLISRGLAMAALLTFVLFVLFFTEVIYGYGSMHWTLLGFIGLLRLVFEFKNPKGGNKYVGILFTLNTVLTFAAFIASCVSVAQPAASGIGLETRVLFSLCAMLVFGQNAYVNLVSQHKEAQMNILSQVVAEKDASTGEARVKPSRSSMKRCSACCWTFFTFLVVLASMHVLIFTSDQVKFFPGEDKFVEVGGRMMFARCMGEKVPGKHPVLFAHGLGGNSLDFSWVQRNISKYTRTCSYDRAGYAHSRERGQQPRNSKQIAEEMAELAEKVGFTDGYIIIGHSFAGFNTRMLHSLYPERVKGLVLIDPVIETATIDKYCDPSAKLVDYLNEFGVRITSSGIFDILFSTPVIQNWVDVSLLPEDIQEEYLSHYTHTGFFRTRADEWIVWGQSCSAVKNIPNKTLDMPFHLIIPTHGIHEKDLQKPRDLANLSPQSTYIEITDEEADHVSILHNEKYAQISITSLLTVLDS